MKKYMGKVVMRGLYKLNFASYYLLNGAEYEGEVIPEKNIYATALHIRK